MTLADWADVTTITASALAVLGIGWLVFVRIRRHRRFNEDYEYLCAELKRLVDEHNEAVEKSLEEIKKLSATGKPISTIERIEASISLMIGQLDDISSHLRYLQNISLAEYFRQHDADEEVASLLTNWKLRSPIIRREHVD